MTVGVGASTPVAPKSLFSRWLTVLAVLTALAVSVAAVGWIRWSVVKRVENGVWPQQLPPAPHALP